MPISRINENIGVDAELLPELRAVSARIGSNRLLVQAAGGNTSVKIDDAMLIKASGFWLADALDKDIFVSLDLPALRSAIKSDDPRADTAVAFVLQSENPNGLRPSIETSLHAIFDHKYVLHVHCIRTLSYAIRKNAEAELAAPLCGLDWVFVPYARPGLPLTSAICAVKNKKTNIAVLGNHGLVVAGDTLAETQNLLIEVQTRLVRAEPKAAAPVALDKLCEGSGYAPVDDGVLHALAFDRSAIKRAACGPLYPDHVIFLGAEMGVHTSGELPVEADVPMIIVPGQGVVLKRGATPAMVAMSRCLADVLLPLPGPVSLRYLNDGEIGQLTNWDAEIYRQKLDQTSP